MSGFFKKLFSRDKKETSEKLDAGMEKTRQGVWNKISRAIAGKSTIDDDVLDDLEEAFITSDVGVDTTKRILDRIRERVARDKYTSTAELDQYLCEEISAMLAENSANNRSMNGNEEEQMSETNDPYVIMVVGVNGVGKTTTIGKLAWMYKQAGNSVVLGAADTFRTGAIEQLEIWGERVGVPVIKQKMFSDPASVALDTLQYAKAKGADVVIIDTSGRLHTKRGLMDELSKIKRVMKKVIPGAPDEILLVLDGGTGQNAYEQVKSFMEATDVNELAITKLDGTAKGGVVIGISDNFKVPVKYIGIGEGIEDLQIFDAMEFVRSLFGTTARKG